MSTQISDATVLADHIAAVSALTPMIRTECADVDRTRQIPTVVVDALRDAGVFRMLAPRDMGGFETDPHNFLRVVEEVSYADGSAGWCTMIAGCYATFSGMLPRQGGQEIFGDPATISAGSFRPDKSSAEEVDGGYRLSGRWALAGSGVSTWSAVASPVSATP